MTATGAPAPQEMSPLSDFLAPLGIEEFVRDYWAAEALYVPGQPAKFRDVFDEPRFRVAVAPHPGLPDDPGFQLNAILPDRAGRPLTRMSTERVRPETVDDVLARGITLCVNKISARDARLHDLAGAAARELGWTGAVWFNAYLSPDDSGADLHWDTQVTTTLQISGRKRWRYAARPSVAWPERTAYMAPDGTVTYYGREPEAAGIRELHADPTVFEEVLLEPGDLLCLPAGTWHSAKAIGHSLALNLAFSRPRTADVVAGVIQSLLSLEPDWRSALRPAPGAGAAGTDVPSDLLEILAERVAQAAQALGSVPRGDRAVADAWRRLVSQR